MKYRNGILYFCFHTEVSYLEPGLKKKIELSFDRENAEDAYVKVSRNVQREENGLQISLKVENVGEKPIKLLRMDPLVISREEDINMGIPWEECSVYLSRRHKNEMPSVVKLGRNDASMSDALGERSESGDEDLHIALTELCSDTMTLLHAGTQNLLIGFPDGSKFFCETRIHLPGSEGIALRVGCTPEILLPPGGISYSEILEIQCGSSWQQLIEDFSKRKHTFFVGRERVPKPSVYCTWYYYGLTISYEDVKNNLFEMDKRGLNLDVFQIDEGWEITLGEWEPNAKFPLPMKSVAKKIREYGMIPGIWTSPFIAHESASIWKKHGEWKLCDSSGKPVLFPMNDTVYQVLDITHPEVEDYVERLYRRLREDWGYTYHKLDFTRAAVIYPNAAFYDRGISLVEAYRRCMKAVRRGIGEDSYLLVCGGLYDPLIGIADAQRTGSDILSMWTSESHRDGKTVPFTVKQNLLRYYMGEWWDNDADCLMLRQNTLPDRGQRLSLGLLNEEELRVMLLNQYLSGGLFSITEKLESIEGNRLWRIRHLLPQQKLKIYPELFHGERFPSRVSVRGRNSNLRELVLFNWEDHPVPGPVVYPELEMGVVEEDGERQGLFTEFFSRRWWLIEKGSACALAEIPAHSALLLRYQRREPEKAYVVASDGHYSMGEELRRLFVSEEGELVLEAERSWPVKTDYTILLPETWTDIQGSRTAELTLLPGETECRVRLYRNRDMCPCG